VNYVFAGNANGIDASKLAFLMELKNEKRGRIKEYADKFGCEFLEVKTPWGVNCDIALPCETQNELQCEDAKVLVSNCCICVAESVLPAPGRIRETSNTPMYDGSTWLTILARQGYAGSASPAPLFISSLAIFIL
jgi:hypothetical protein